MPTVQEQTNRLEPPKPKADKMTHFLCFVAGMLFMATYTAHKGSAEPAPGPTTCDRQLELCKQDLAVMRLKCN